MKNKRSEDWFESVGKHLKIFIKEKFPTQKEASKTLGISETAISRLISGARLPSRQLTLKIIKLGFDKKYLDDFESLEDIRPDELTKVDLIDLLRERRIFAKQQSDLIDFLSERLTKVISNAEQWRAIAIKNEKKNKLATNGNSDNVAILQESPEGE